MTQHTAFLRTLMIAGLLGAAGCASLDAQEQVPLTQDALDAFLAKGRDARYHGITIYHDAAGDRFEFANRLHQDRGAEMDFVSPRSLKVPLIEARTYTFVDFNLLLDSSARQNWLLLQSIESMGYRVFAPPTGEHPDHVESALPGYAGVANKIVMDTLHVESPVFYVLPATGGLGPLARVTDRSDDLLDEAESKRILKRERLGNRTHAVMGAALMRSFAYIRFDFTTRKIRFSSHSTYHPVAASSVKARLPMLNWRGRPVVEGTLNGEPIQLLVDTAGDFDLSLPGDMEDFSGTLVLGDLEFEEVDVRSHASLGLPERFPARIGLGLLSRHLLTLDHKQHLVWLEELVIPEEEAATVAADENTPDPVLQYPGIRK